MLQVCEIIRHVSLLYGRYLDFWSVIVFSSQGDSESEKKSLSRVLMNVYVTTSPQR